MKITFVLLSVMAAALAIPTDSGETYKSEFEKVDVQEILDNERLLINYLNCFLDKGPCTTDGLEYKENIPGAVRDGCSKCTPKHKELVRIFIRGIQTKQPSLWDELVAQHDPKSEFGKELDKFLNESE